MSGNRSVLVAMSGGVDSTIAAHILKEQGYHVEGLYLELLGTGFEEVVRLQKERVLEIGSILGVRVHVLDLKKEFSRCVISYFIESYKKGLTPNPCTICNPMIKFKKGLSLAERLGLDLFATGHYARIDTHPQLGLVLKKGADPKKDQSYFLYRLRPEWLKKILFPLGQKTKTQVRELAEALGLRHQVLTESQEVCFIKGDYREFLIEHGEKDRPGPIVLKETRRIVGQHQGVFKYTIGQRRGLGIPGPEPYYVIGLDVGKNRVYIGTKKDTFRTSFFIEDVNWLVAEEYLFDTEIQIKIRSRHRAARGRIFKEAPGSKRYRIEFEVPQSAVTPGQAAVVYADDIVLGGGIICL